VLTDIWHFITGRALYFYPSMGLKKLAAIAHADLDFGGNALAL